MPTRLGSPELIASALGALHEIAVLSAQGRGGDAAAVAELAGRHAGRLLGVEGVAVFSWDAEAGLLQPIYETASPVREGPAQPGEGIVGRAFQTLTPVMVTDYGAHEGAVESARRRGMGGALAVPMVVAGQPVGVLGVWAYEPRPFTDDEVQLLAVFAAQVAPAVEAARRSAQRDRSERTLAALHQVSVAGSTVHDLAEIARVAAERACRLLEGAAAVVMWYEPENDVLRCLAGHGDLPAEPGWTVVPGQGISGRAFQERRPVAVDDYSQWEHHGERAGRAGIGSVMAVPLVIQDRALGALMVGWPEPRTITGADRDALSLLGSQVAGALETAHLVSTQERQVKSLTALHEVAVAAAGVMDSEALAQLAVDRARDALGVDSAVLRWWEPDRGTLRLLASNDPQPGRHGAEISPHQGVIGMAFSTQRHAVIDNYHRSAESLAAAAEQGVVTALGVPLMVGQRAVGAIAVASGRAHIYDGEQIQLLQLMAGQLAPALEAARLAGERERHLRSVSTLIGFATAAAGILDIGALAELSVDTAAKLLPGALPSLGMLGAEGQGLELVADRTTVSGSRLAAGEGAMGEAFARVETVVVEDYGNYERAWTKGLAMGVKSVLAVPLLAGDQPVGALGLCFQTERRFTQDEVQSVRLLAALVGPLLSAARLHSDLARSERRLRGLHSAMLAGLMVFNRDGLVVDVNEAGLRMFELDRSQLDGRRLPEIAGYARIDAGGDPLAPEERPFRHVMETGRPVQASVMGFKRPDGTEFWIQVEAVPVFDAAGEVEQVISSFIDITSVRRADQAQRESEAKTRFLASMSHELRTPLNSILGFAQLLDKETFGPLTDRQRRYVGHITASGQHLLELVNDILDLSKVVAGQMETHIEDVAVQQVVEDVLSRLRPMADERGLWITHAVGDDLVVRADRRRLQQVLVNLVSNAIKFTPHGGSVAVEAGRRGRQGVISVRDNGKGIPRDQHARIFQEFTQLDDGRRRQHEGTGLGLPLTRRLVELMGGQLTLESEVGRGSKFSFTLPAVGRH